MARTLPWMVSLISSRLWFCHVFACLLPFLLVCLSYLSCIRSHCAIHTNLVQFVDLSPFYISSHAFGFVPVVLYRLKNIQRVPLLVLRKLSPAFIVRTHLVCTLCPCLCVVAVCVLCWFIFEFGVSSLLACCWCMTSRLAFVRSVMHIAVLGVCSCCILLVVYCLCIVCHLRVRSFAIAFYICLCLFAKGYVLILRIFTVVFFVFSSECVDLSPLSAFVRVRFAVCYY